VIIVVIFFYSVLLYILCSVFFPSCC